LTHIDVSRWDEGEAEQKRLAKQLHDAMTTQGFFVLTGHCISEEEITRQVDIGFVSWHIPLDRRGIAAFCSIP
jgi:isopenicillin N synthase-like dioxygenase